MSESKINVRGYTIGREAEYGGLMIVRDADGNKIGSSQTETAARSIVRNDERRKSRTVTFNTPDGPHVCPDPRFHKSECDH